MPLRVCDIHRCGGRSEWAVGLIPAYGSRFWVRVCEGHADELYESNRRIGGYRIRLAPLMEDT